MVNIGGQRLENQRIARSKFKTAGEVVSWLGAIQGQDYASVEWSVGLRLPGSTQAVVDQALEDRSIVRTWMLRGTLHFVAGADVHWMLALLAPKLIAGNARRYKELELDEPTMMRANELLVKSFQQSAVSDQPKGQKTLSRTELLAMLEENGIATKGQRGIFMLQRAALDGLLCRGITRGGNDLYMALDFSPSKSMAQEESLSEFARRYFASHGPATFQDFVWWTGLKTSDARAGFEAVKSEFVAETVDGKEYWMRETAKGQLTLTPNPSPSGRGEKIQGVGGDIESLSTTPSIFLLPGFDEYILGYKDRGAVLDAQYANLICPGGNGVFYPTIVSNGRVVGTWKRAFKKGKVIMTPSPFTALSDDEMSGFEQAAARFGAFVGMEAVTEN